MAEDNSQEKSLPASERRIQQAREEGQVARSRELVTAMIALASVGALWWGGGAMLEEGKLVVREGLHFNAAAVFDPSNMGSRLADYLMHGGLALAPLFAAVVVAALLGSIAIGGWNFSSNGLIPNFERLSPLAGLKRMFSVNGAQELLKAILKAVLLGGLGMWLVWRNGDALVNLLTQDSRDSLHAFADLALSDFLMLVGGLVLIAALDVPFQLWQYLQQLRMSPEELRREMKETEGDPYLKARIRSQQREIARRRMMEAVPKADVVVTNPSHYAVALKYSDTGIAPKVVAKGTELIAQKIRELAAANDVPVMEAPPLARALYFSTGLEQDIPPPLYTAVAQVLAYVYQLKAWRQWGGMMPVEPAELAVPAGMDEPKFATGTALAE
ncbi:MAG: flagellar type III secretion system protein FlhB [Burkholderiaceae bacterium]|nr:MAG: flagellar type III secretion system protein FlhB [Burkholderiaceae bacterium]